MNGKWIMGVFFILWATVSWAEPKGETRSTGPFEPTWESLSLYEIPPWYQDAKFGIFIHWGVYSVPAFLSEWYPRQMYIPGTLEYLHHRQVWGDQGQFGYKDFVPMFKAEKWDPESWASLFEEAGAKYVVPVAEHHDGFAMYASSHTPWNSVDMGPHRDVIKELGDAVRRKGLKFGVSSHYAWNWHYYAHEPAFDTMTPAHELLYGKPHPKDTPSSPEFLELWRSRCWEIVDRYQPDLFYFDFCIGAPEFEPYRKAFAAHYYNRASEWGKGVVIHYKGEAYPVKAAVYDIERGKSAELRDRPWQTDTSVSLRSWGYTDNDVFRTPDSLVDDLVDIVSKNGCLLLNIGPRSDGTIPDEVQVLLKEMGAWLKVNGEAIYGTRPWRIFGEGPTEVKDGSMTDKSGKVFTGQDLRFTRKDNALYVTLLGWPDGETVVRDLGKKSVPEATIQSVRMLGSERKVRWHQEDDGLHIQRPRKASCDHAHVFKIEWSGLGS